ncbi:MAG: glycosyltransferase family 4 protein, partial [Myxococcota bacterium]
MRRLEIGLVCQNVVRRDGQGRVSLEVARALLQRGHAVTVYAHRLDDELAGRVAFRRIPRPPGPQLVDDLVFLVVATLFVRRASHDSVCVLGPTALPRRPFAYDAQFSHRGWRRTWTRATRPGLYHRIHARIIGALETFVARRADRVISSTAALGAELLAGAEAKTVVVPNGVDLSEFTTPDASERAAARERFGLGDRDLAIGFFGGWTTPRKGLDPLLRALALSTDGEKLLLAHEGDRSALQERTRELHVGERVHVAGFEPPRTVLAACDLVCVPSLYEPWSLVAFEAAASGVPVVISADAGAAAHLEGAAAVVEAPEPELLREAIDRLRTDPGERRRLASAARRAAEALTWEAAMVHAAEVIEEIAVSHASPAPLRALEPEALRAAASVAPDAAQRTWSRALGRGWPTSTLASLLQDWSEWSAKTYPEMLRTIAEAQE